MSSILRKFEEHGVLKAAEDAITEAVWQSMKADKAKGASEMALTRAEQKHRGDLCLSILDVLVLQKGWGLKRATDHLYRYLRAELDKIPWSPDTRSIWVAGDDY